MVKFGIMSVWKIQLNCPNLGGYLFLGKAIVPNAIIDLWRAVFLMAEPDILTVAVVHRILSGNSRTLSMLFLNRPGGISGIFPESRLLLRRLCWERGIMPAEIKNYGIRVKVWIISWFGLFSCHIALLCFAWRTGRIFDKIPASG